MKKKQTKQQHQKREKDDSLKLGDLIGGDIMEQLKNKQKELTEVAAAEKAVEEKKKKEERKLREKNKSFEELLGESELNWKNYK